MSQTRFVLDIAIDITIGIMMLAIVVGAIMVSIPPAAPETLSSATTVPSSTTETPEKGSQAVVLVPVNPSDSYISITQRPLYNQATNTAGAVTVQPPTENAATPPSTQTVAQMQTGDYIGVFAIVTAIAVVFNFVNYSIHLVYRLGIPAPKTL